MERPNLEQLESAAHVVYQHLSPTPQYAWPLLQARLGVQVWTKHENFTPLGAFKIRGGLVYFDQIQTICPDIQGVVSATRGNHGQSVAFAASKQNISSKIVVPVGNSVEKNRAMVALGATLVEVEGDFQDALDHANKLQQQENLHLVPSFHPLLVRGVASYSLELFRHVPEIDVLYVPIGLGSGICGAIAARNALQLKTEIVGVTSSQAPAYKSSFEQMKLVEAPVTTRLADGMACRRPQPQALEIIQQQVSRVTDVSDEEVAQAMRDVFECTHTVAEGAGASAIAAIRKDSHLLQNKKVAAIITGGNVDRQVFQEVLANSAFML